MSYLCVKLTLHLVKQTILMIAKNENWTKRTQKNVLNLAFWTILWLLTMALVVFGAKFLWNFNSVISALFIVTNAAIGVGMIRANKKYLDGLDELQRKMNFDAMAIALGVGVVGGLSFSLLDITNLIAFDAEISFMVLLIGITYLIGIVITHSRYQ